MALISRHAFGLRIVSTLVIASLLVSCSPPASTAVTSPQNQPTPTITVPTNISPTISIPTEIGPDGSEDVTERISFQPGDPAPKIPAPQPLLAIPTGTAVEQARSLSQSLVGGSQDLPTWLRLYDMLGVPIIDESGNPLGSTGDDPIGPRYWLVWYTASLNRPQRGVSLTDAGRILAIGSDGLDPLILGKALLSDLQISATSTNPQIQLVGEFIRQRGLSTSQGIDLLDPIATPENVYIDIPSLGLLYWVMLRQFAYANLDLVASATNAPKVALLRVPLQQFQSSQPPCSETLGNSDITYWTNWLSKQGMSGGLHLPGMENPLTSIIEILQEEQKLSGSQIESFNKKMAAAGSMAAALSLLMQVMALDVNITMNVDKLERHKKISMNQGKSMVITWALVSDPGNLPDGNDPSLCFLSTLSNMFGVGVSMPASGRISDAEIVFEGGQGFDRVMFGNFEQVRAFTDQFGEAELEVIGRVQKRNYPDDAKARDMEFSVSVKAQPEGAGLNTIINSFLNGLSFGAGGMKINAGVLGPIIDMLKLVRFSLGEFYFPMVDWDAPGYRAEGTSGEAHYSGIICDLAEPFTVDVTFIGGTGALLFAPNSANGGSYTITGGGSGVTLDGTGTYTVSGTDSENPVITGQSYSCTSLGELTCRNNTEVIQLSPLAGEGCE